MCIRDRVELITAPEVPPRNQTLLRNRSPFGGLLVANLSPAVSDELGLNENQPGVVVMEVKGGPAARVGFRTSDIIIELNDRPIKTVKELQEAIKLSDGWWDFAIKRGGRVRRIQLGG